MTRGFWSAVLQTTVLSGATVLCASPAARAAQLSDRPPAPAHLKARLVSEASAVAPGQKFWIGLDFTLDPGWHVYWINPGDSGQPPRVTWSVPAGYEVGALEWPQPSRLADSGTVVDYGYTGHLVLMAPVSTQPSSVRAGTSATIAADVSWLVCRDICVPGKTRLSLPVRVAPQATIDAAQHAVFEATRRRVPRAMPAAWTASAHSTRDSFVISIDTGRAEKTAAFFPLEDLQVDNAAPQRAETLARGVRLTVKKAEELRASLQTLNGVFVIASGSAYLVHIPVK